MWACDIRVANFVATIANQKEEWIAASKKALKTKQNKAKLKQQQQQQSSAYIILSCLYKSVKVKPNSLVKFFYRTSCIGLSLTYDEKSYKYH